jgi:Response regulators consisting of a CheY-like receiver domain and a winged-helix DNA-binding domain
MERILFVKDDLSLISGLSFAFKKQGFEIDIARTNLEANTLWVDRKYDLIILDVSLPDGSGFIFQLLHIVKLSYLFLFARIILHIQYNNGLKMIFLIAVNSNKRYNTSIVIYDNR